ncbi:MAG: hypothetical protein QM477_01455 [Planctomycetota bacterium]
MRTTLTSLAFGLVAMACSTGTTMDQIPEPTSPAIPASMTQEATFAAG